MRQLDIVRPEVFQSEKSDHALRYRMTIDRIVAVVKISDNPVLTEKVGTVECEPATEAGFELRGFRELVDQSQGA
jgi:hypothetical protein